MNQSLHKLFSLKRSLSLLLAIAFALSCAPGIDSQVRNTRTCLQNITQVQLRKIAKEFIHAKRTTRSKLLEGIHYLADNAEASKAFPYKKLAHYLDDINSTDLRPLDGSEVDFAPFENVQSIAWPFEPVEIQPRTWQPIIQPVWNSYPIPEHLMVQDYPVFRGERDLLKGLQSSEFALAENSVVWAHLKALFANGTTSYDKPSRDIWHQDVFKHTEDSLGSPYLGSTKDVEIARKFGRKPATHWSAVIEARIDGIDINKTGEYFETFDFLQAPKSMLPIEKEIAINYGIRARDIRGVWFFEENGLTYFVQNPNYED